MSRVEWFDLAQIADVLKDPNAGPKDISDVQWRKIEQTLVLLRRQTDWPGIVRLRLLFKDICTRDTFTGTTLVHQLEEEAILAAEQLEDKHHLAIFWGDRGHNLHRQGLHRESIDAFNKSSKHYDDLNNSIYVLRNHLMVALCYRALNYWKRARTITIEILKQVPENDPWRGQPLQVLAWLYKDKGDWKNAEAFLREVLKWQEQSENPDILVAGSLADLGEVLALQRRFEEAWSAFIQSLAILEKHKGQYHRQEARTKLKLAEMFSRQRHYQLAMQYLREADELCCIYGHYYDQLWKVEMVTANVLFHTGDYHSAVRKLASALHIRKRLNLPAWLLVRQILVRLGNSCALRAVFHF